MAGWLWLAKLQPFQVHWNTLRAVFIGFENLCTRNWLKLSKDPEMKTMRVDKVSLYPKSWKKVNTEESVNVFTQLWWLSVLFLMAFDRKSWWAVLLPAMCFLCAGIKSSPSQKWSFSRHCNQLGTMVMYQHLVDALDVLIGKWTWLCVNESNAEIIPCTGPFLCVCFVMSNHSHLMLIH